MGDEDDGHTGAKHTTIHIPGEGDANTNIWADIGTRSGAPIRPLRTHDRDFELCEVQATGDGPDMHPKPKKKVPTPIAPPKRSASAHVPFSYYTWEQKPLAEPVATEETAQSEVMPESWWYSEWGVKLPTNGTHAAAYRPPASDQMPAAHGLNVNVTGRLFEAERIEFPTRKEIRAA